MEYKKLSPMECKVITLSSMLYEPSEIKIILEKYHNKTTPYGFYTIYDFLKQVGEKLGTKSITETARKAKNLGLCSYNFGNFDFENVLKQYKESK
jgi:hypothetical protein